MSIVNKAPMFLTVRVAVVGRGEYSPKTERIGHYIKCTVSLRYYRGGIPRFILIFKKMATRGGPKVFLPAGSARKTKALGAAEPKHR